MRQPKYLLGGILGIAYLYFAFIHKPQPRPGRPAPPNPFSGIEGLTPLLFQLLAVVVLVLMWLWPRKRASHFFTEAEVTFLFPAPVSHRMLVHYTLLKNQATLLLSALFLTLISLRWETGIGMLPFRFVGTWMVLSLLTLHTTASAFTLTRLQDLGLRQWQRQLLVLAVVVVSVILVDRVSSRGLLPSAHELGNSKALKAYFEAQNDGGALYWMLSPVRWIFQPMLAENPLVFLSSLAPALLILVLHYAWAVAADIWKPNNANALVAAIANRHAMLL